MTEIALHFPSRWLSLIKYECVFLRVVSIGFMTVLQY